MTDLGIALEHSLRVAALAEPILVVVEEVRIVAEHGALDRRLEWAASPTFAQSHRPGAKDTIQMNQTGISHNLPNRRTQLELRIELAHTNLATLGPINWRKNR